MSQYLTFGYWNSLIVSKAYAGSCLVASWLQAEGPALPIALTTGTWLVYFIARYIIWQGPEIRVPMRKLENLVRSEQESDLDKNWPAIVEESRMRYAA